MKSINRRKYKDDKVFDQASDEAIFIGLFSLILGLVLIINNAFLGHYYLSHKADDLIRTYNDVNAKLESGSLSDSDSVRDILTQLERANVDLVVVDGGGNAILTTLGESDPRLKEMFSGLFGMEGVDHENILKRNEDYTIYRDKSSQVQRDVEYLKMWGRFMDAHGLSCSVLMRVLRKVHLLQTAF